MKKTSLTIITLFSLILRSCEKTNKLNYLNGYWEITSVKKNGSKIKNYPFNGTIDYFILDKDLSSGFRKKVKPKIDGNFDITMHQIEFNIDEEKKYLSLFKCNMSISDSQRLVYGEGENFIEYIVKIDSMNLVIKNSDGYSYSYKRFYPINYLNERN